MNEHTKNIQQQRRINRRNKAINDALEILKPSGEHGLELSELACQLDMPLNRLGNYLSRYAGKDDTPMVKMLSKKNGRWLSAYAYKETETVLNSCDLQHGNGEGNEPAR